MNNYRHFATGPYSRGVLTLNQTKNASLFSLYLDFLLELCFYHRIESNLDRHDDDDSKYIHDDDRTPMETAFWVAGQPTGHPQRCITAGYMYWKESLDGTMKIVKQPWILFANSLRNYHILALMILVYQKVIISYDIIDNIWLLIKSCLV